MLHIPESLTDFLHWLKDQTETYFREHPRREVGSGDYQCWQPGTHWVGLLDSEIADVEAQYDIQFAPDHREFLRILHTLNQPCAYEKYSESVYGGHPNLFYNWLTDEAEIRERLAQPYEDLRLNWLPVWGPRPATEAAQAAGFTQHFNQAPALVPLTGHRYLVSEPLHLGNPVLSIWADDIIVYGWNLRSYLLHELSGYLAVDLARPVLEADELVDWEAKPEVAAIFQADYAASLHRRIPFYEDFIQTWNGWPPRAGTAPYGPITTP